MSNIPLYTVSEISGALKRVVEEGFARVRVRGEISRVARPASGHVYFTLKDESAVLDSVCWRGTAGKLNALLEDGLEVIAEGRLTTYAGRSSYQIVVDSIEIAGEGALLKMIEERKKKLAAEGLFDAARKKKIPYLPEVIGVITSPTGAVIRDILHRLADRFPRRVLIWGVPVQGEGAGEKIAAAIAGFNAIPAGGPIPRPDVLIVARGGGSIEDLMPFNEEVVVRAAAASAIPLISGVGHEPDVTLIDFAADLRAPTPTAAAEMAVPVRAELLENVMGLAKRLFHSMSRMVRDRRDHVAALTRALGQPSRLIESAVQRLDHAATRHERALRELLRERAHALAALGAQLRPRLLASDLSRRGESLISLSRRLGLSLRQQLQGKRSTLSHLSKLLESYSYRNVLSRGFAVIRDGAGAPITRACAALPGMSVSIEFADDARAATIQPAGKAAGEITAKKTPPSDNSPQGSLL